MKLSHISIAVLLLISGNAMAGLEGAQNTFYGTGAGAATLGDDDQATFVGALAGNNNTGPFNTFVGNIAGRFNTTGQSNTFLGYSAGNANTTGNSNTFVGNTAGRTNTTGFNNSFFGVSSGVFTTTGQANTFVGTFSGQENTAGGFNTFVGMFAGGTNTTGTGNVFLGYGAGYNGTDPTAATLSNRLFIANSDTTTPLVYGEFDNKKVTLNGNLEVIGPDNGLVRLSDVTTNLNTKGSRMVLRHYDNAQLPVYLFGAASTPTQNFVAFGGGNNIGNAATQLDLFTAPTTTTSFGFPRLTILGNGNVGIGTQGPTQPLQMASGAHVTAGGVWTNASSRDYKENIKDLSTKEAALTLASLTPVTYNYKVDKTQAHVGFIAEDVPELVATKDRKGLSPMDIVAVLTKVTQEQQRMIDAQQQVIVELREENKAIIEQIKLIPTLSAALTELKREVRRERTTALAD